MLFLLYPKELIKQGNGTHSKDFVGIFEAKES